MFLTTPLPEIAVKLGATLEGLGDEPARLNIAPGETIAVLEQGHLIQMRWGILPVARKNARGRPVMETIINARSETVFDKTAFEGVRRCVVPVDGWYEWTGETRKKTVWRIAMKDETPLYFAAIADTWVGPGGIKLDQVATVTCPPNADLKDIHHRMGVLLRRDDIGVWLGEDEAAARALMVPWPDGLLDIRKTEDPGAI
ncbi:SOS response-associated peptidase [Litoreibacter roseus]|nr:SOS response-associated peptidase [Litoreibacter roseus]